MNIIDNSDTQTDDEDDDIRSTVYQMFMKHPVGTARINGSATCARLIDLLFPNYVTDGVCHPKSEATWRMMDIVNGIVDAVTRRLSETHHWSDEQEELSGDTLLKGRRNGPCVRKCGRNTPDPVEYFCVECGEQIDKEVEDFSEVSE